MCGIAGYWRKNGEAKESIAVHMVSQIQHRGPDDSGVWMDAGLGVAIGHRRLSIIDLSPQGHQPMTSASGRYIIAYNGEVYNFPKLRKELEREGETFRGHSDTEVILGAIETWGLKAAAKRFIGMFAFALWDRREQRLNLVRDRLGIKPLYYGRVNEAFIFGSELKALRAFPGFSQPIDRGALALLMRHNCVPAPYLNLRKK
jgi:asparagine synthase (glutamine-hydrolysing)